MDRTLGFGVDKTGALYNAKLCPLEVIGLHELIQYVVELGLHRATYEQTKYKTSSTGKVVIYLLHNDSNKKKRKKKRKG